MPSEEPAVSMTIGAALAQAADVFARYLCRMVRKYLPLKKHMDAIRQIRELRNMPTVTLLGHLRKVGPQLLTDPDQYLQFICTPIDPTIVKRIGTADKALGRRLLRALFKTAFREQ